MKTKQTKMKLELYKLEKDCRLKRFKVTHHNGDTILEQDLTVKKTNLVGLKLILARTISLASITNLKQC